MGLINPEIPQPPKCAKHPSPGIVRWEHQRCTCEQSVIKPAWAGYINPFEKRFPDKPTVIELNTPAPRIATVSSNPALNAKVRERWQMGACPCLCHIAENVACGRDKCCSEAKGLGETDTASIDIQSEDEHPWTMSYISRKWNKQTMSETMHLHWTITGDENAKDLFYIVVHALDNDFPIKPERKADATVPMCKKCKGLEWERAILTPSELKRAAKQCGVEVKVHHWMKAKRCTGLIEQKIVG